MIQLGDNDLIISDFGVLKPKKGHGMWSTGGLRLSNHVRISGFPVEGRKRGARPDIFVFDDPEFDSKNEVSASRLRSEFERTLFRQILPMLEDYSRLFWIGTVIDRRSFIYYALTNKEDKRFRKWNRRLVAAEEVDNDGNQVLIWPEKWTTERLEFLRDSLGPAAYAAEMLNNPISEDETILHVDEKLDTYIIKGGFDPDPYMADSVVHSYHSDPRSEEVEKKEDELGKFIRSLYIIMLVDYAPTITAFSDFSAAHVMGFDRDDTLWSLDLWAGKVRSAELIGMIYKLGCKWRPRIVGVEAVSIQYEIYEQVKASMPSSGDWVPRVLPVRYPPNTSKASRIGGLEWRFNRHRIKYPRDRKSNPAYKMLYFQTENFTSDLALLEHDDCIDTIAMVPFVLRGRGKDFQGETDKIRDISNPRGSGVTTLSGLNASDLTQEEVEKLLDGEWDGAYNPDGLPLSETRVI